VCMQVEDHDRSDYNVRQQHDRKLFIPTAQNV
jgi:hypothetical protein